MTFRDLHEGVLEEFASAAWCRRPEYRPGARVSGRTPETNRAHQAAWRARQTKAALRARRRAEYLRNREARLAYQRAYQAGRRLAKV